MKNAITVIDQEFIDHIENEIDLGGGNIENEEISELLCMAKDLIEINAELTADKVKKTFFVKGLLNEINQTAGTGTIKASRFYKALKADSD